MQFKKSTRKNKKYMVTVNNKTVHFGDTRYQHYFDKIGLYSHLNHMDKDRRRNFRKRHFKNSQVKYSPAWFALHYLW